MSKLVEQVRERIESRYCQGGEVGTRLPPERELVRHLGVSRQTIRAAMAHMVGEGRLTRYRGRGTFVAQPPAVAAPGLTAPLTLGLILRGMNSSNCASFTAALLQAVREYDAAALVQLSNADPLAEVELLRDMHRRKVHGVLLQTAMRGTVDSAILARQLDALRGPDCPPLVLLQRDDRFTGATQVWIDDEQAGYLATRHLIEQGHKRIAHLAMFATSLGPLRERGYRRAMAEAGLEVPDGYVLDIEAVPRSPSNVEMGRNSARIFFSLARRPTAVFAYWAEVGAGVMLEALQRGLSVPEDLAVIGVAHLTEQTQSLLPLSMTTLHYDLNELAARGVEELVREIEGEPRGRHVQLPLSLITGQSTVKTARIARVIPMT